MKSFPRMASAFSLLETLLAVAIIGVLAAIGIVQHRASLENVRVAKLESDVATINTAIRTYVANGGSLAGITNPQAILDKMKTTRSAIDDARFVGLSGSMIDPRLASRSSNNLASGRPRAVWDATDVRFEIATTGSGAASFYFDDVKGKAVYGTEAREASAFSYNTGDGSVWDYNDGAPLPRPTPTLVPIAGIPTEGDGGDGSDPTPWSDPVPSGLLPPTFSIPGGSFPPSRFTFALELINPNPGNSSWILVSVDGSPFQAYQGAISINPETVVEAFVAGDPDVWKPSATASHTYSAADPIQLEAPSISSSQSQFAWSTAETISVSVSNPNDPEVSGIEYQIEGSEWASYGGPFELSIEDYPNGAVITARATALTIDYTASPTASSAITAAAQPVQLLAPAILPSASNFVAGSVETICSYSERPERRGLRTRLPDQW